MPQAPLALEQPMNEDTPHLPDGAERAERAEQVMFELSDRVRRLEAERQEHEAELKRLQASLDERERLLLAARQAARDERALRSQQDQSRARLAQLERQLGELHGSMAREIAEAGKLRDLALGALEAAASALGAAREQVAAAKQELSQLNEELGRRLATEAELRARLEETETSLKRQLEQQRSAFGRLLERARAEEGSAPPAEPAAGPKQTTAPVVERAASAPTVETNETAAEAGAADTTPAVETAEAAAAREFGRLREQHPTVRAALDALYVKTGGAAPPPAEPEAAHQRQPPEAPRPRRPDEPDPPDHLLGGRAEDPEPPPRPEADASGSEPEPPSKPDAAVPGSADEPRSTSGSAAPRSDASNLRAAQAPVPPGVGLWATTPWLSRGLRCLAHSDPEAAGRLFLQLLPAHGLIERGQLEYDLSLEGIGCLAVSVRAGATQIDERSHERPESETDFRLRTDLRGLGRFVTAGRLRSLAARMPGPRRGRHDGGAASLRQLARAQLGVRALRSCGAQLDPVLAFTALAASFDPKWIAGEHFVVAQEIAGPPQHRCYIVVDGDRGVRVQSSQPDAPPSATVRCATSELHWSLGEGGDGAIEGDPLVVAKLRGWVARVDGTTGSL